MRDMLACRLAITMAKKEDGFSKQYREDMAKYEIDYEIDIDQKDSEH